jgi:peroxiredoxin
MDNQRLGIGADFPKITLTDIENKTITIPDDIKTKYCILLFIRGTW